MRRLPDCHQPLKFVSTYQTKVLLDKSQNPIDRIPRLGRQTRANRPDLRVVMIQEHYLSRNFAANFQGKPIILDTTGLLLSDCLVSQG